ncbi:predicted protein, partial [Nematostella vectensis]
KDCAQFYFCDGSAESLLSRCPRGLLWSEVKKTCDYPHLVDCSRPTTPPVTTTKSTTSSTTKGTTASTTTSTPTTTPTTRPPCNLHCQTLNPDGTCTVAPGDCSSNYICYPPHETLHATCPAGLLWNHITKTCDWPSNVDCDRLSSSEIVCPFLLPDKPNGHYADPRDCSKFYQCDAFHRAFLHRCPAGLKWSVKKTACDWPRYVDC